MPQPNDLLSDSQGDILDNFTSLNATYGINHYAFDDTTAGTTGLHKYVGMPVRGAAPATLPGEGALYFKNPGTGTALFMVRDNNLGTEVQLTTASVGNVQSSTNGFCWLPGGLFMQWGLSNVVAGSASINFNTPFSAQAYNVQITPVRSATNVDIVYMVSRTATNFTYFNTSSSGIVQIYWTAIGPKP